MSSTPVPSPPARMRPAAGLVLFAAALAGWGATSRLPGELSLYAAPLVILAATGIAVVLTGADARDVLHLRLPSVADFVMAFPLTVSFFVIHDQMAELSHAAMPVSDELQETLRQLLAADTPTQWLSRIATIGVGAAVSEELLFRGFIQSAFLQGMNRTAAILLTAVLFMLLHPQMLPALAAGLVLGLVTVATRSIVVPVAIHFMNNTIGLLLSNLTELDTFGDPVWIPATMLLPSVAIFALTGLYYWRRLEPEAAGPEDGTPHPIVLRDDPNAIADELSGVSAWRRRLGWLVVAAAMTAGVLVLVGLVAWSTYTIEPQRVHAAGIEALARDAATRLDANDLERADRLARAFQALHALNESGRLELDELWEVSRTYWTLGADGSLSAMEVDALVETIRELIVRKTRARAL